MKETLIENRIALHSFVAHEQNHWIGNKNMIYPNFIQFHLNIDFKILFVHICRLELNQHYYYNNDKI